MRIDLDRSCPDSRHSAASRWGYVEAFDRMVRTSGQGIDRSPLDGRTRPFDGGEPLLATGRIEHF